MTITLLTIHQFLRSKSLLVVVGISLIPIVFAFIPHVILDDYSVRETRRLMSQMIFLNFIATTLLPLATLVLSTAAFGDEIDDRTLHYLALKPLSRWRIVLEKWIAVMILAIPVSWIGTLLTWVIVSWGNASEMRDMIGPLLAASAVGVVGFGSVFLAISLMMNRALLFGVFYVFIWESTLSRFLPGIRNASISHYTRSLYVRLLDDRKLTIDDPSATQTIIITIIVVAVISLGLATWRLRTMAIE